MLMDDIPWRYTDVVNLTHLMAFQAVARHGSVSRAAQELHLSQPAVSKQLAGLEQELSVRLFSRTPKAMRLTEAGAVLLSYSERLFALENEAERAMEEVRGSRRGTLAVGASTTVANYLFPRYLSEFSERFPGVSLDLRVGNTRQVQAWLRQGEIGLGFTEGLRPDEGIESEVFLWDELVLLSSQPPKAALSPTELGRLRLILREAGSGTRAVLQAALARYGIALDDHLVLGSTEAIKGAVKAGLGLAFLSRLAAEAELRAGQLYIHEIEGFQIPRPLFLLRERHTPVSPMVREFLKLLSREEESLGEVPGSTDYA